jgi:hypothetical protein
MAVVNAMRWIVGKRMCLILACGILCLCVCTLAAGTSSDPDALAIISPADGSTTEDFLTATLRWEHPIRREYNGAPYFDYAGVSLRVSQREDLSAPFISVDLPENRTYYRLAVVPQATYYWEVVPRDEQGLRPDKAARARFTTGASYIRADATDEERFRNPREGAHWRHEKPVLPEEHEPLAPWYAVKAYRGGGVPSFDTVRPLLPEPVYDGHPDALDAYWYCWKTLLGVWFFAPEAPDHQAVANICGIKSWGPWGSTMVFDTAFILHFARYGHRAYPFITALDNCYARQHENGFICRESDKNNREVYVIFPVNPPLLTWAEWEWYRITADKARLEEVLLPLVKHYEWFMKYMRRANGLYWTRGEQEADDSPRNALMHYAVSATSYQAMTARFLALMAAEIGRTDLQRFFDGEHRSLADVINASFWDEKHGLYNDLTEDRRFITELEPGKFCKHVHMFWPLLAGVAPEDRVARMLHELQDPASFSRLTGVPSLSADSAGYNTETGQYWRGAVWPSGECMVQEGLKAVGQGTYARELSEKYFNAQLQAFLKEKTIKENMAPDRLEGYGVAEFVGWGGLGPVANLIESVLGFECDAPRNTIRWTITRTERHGIRNVGFCGFAVDMVCAARNSIDDSCVISVKSGGDFRLEIHTNGKVREYPIQKGEQTITCE